MPSLLQAPPLLVGVLGCSAIELRSQQRAVFSPLLKLHSLDVSLFRGVFTFFAFDFAVVIMLV